ncbi:MAG: acyl-CoA/acyl-ACP dehydrogenase, partial [Deltaproteobacteria bacterium]|nr:acyl-CoA/acyl-ACP dehydrogenase [Deltaproteobacteria bacterium]
MNFEFTTEQLAAAKSFADAVRERIACDAERQDTDPGASEHITRAHMKVLGELGWHGLLFDASFGGAGMTHLEWTLYAEALGGLAPTSFLSATSAAGATVRPIAKFGTEAQIERFVRPALRGDVLGAFAVTEADSGSDPLAVKLAAKREGDGWVLDGEKVWATNGPICDFALVLAATKPEGGPNG